MGARGPLRLVHTNTVTNTTIAATMAEKVRGTKAIEKPQAVRDNEQLSEVWDWLVPQLIGSGLAANIDALTLELAVRHYVHAVAASDALFTESLLVAGRDEFKKNPLEAIFRAESLAFMNYTKLLGLSFAARVRMSNPEAEGGADENNPYRSVAQAQ